MKDQFLTLTSPSEGYFMDKGSKFHAYAFPIQSEDEVHPLIAKIRKEHPKARHYCTAMRLNPDASLERSNDDGEPSGSAGKPMLGQLIKNNITNVLVIVVRYFGGTKLGIPGLIEAYKTSTANAILASDIIERNVYTKVRIIVSYDLFPSLLNFCKQNDIRVLDEIFGEEAVIVLGFRKSSAAEDVMKALQQFSKMDFNTQQEYEKHLSLSIHFTGEEEIV